MSVREGVKTGDAGKRPNVSLRDGAVERTATLPSGDDVLVRVGFAYDSYIDREDMDTVAIELRSGDELLAVVNTVLDADQTVEAVELLEEVVAGLESGELEPTAGAIEPLAERRR